jgi:hypothetical protein
MRGLAIKRLEAAPEPAREREHDETFRPRH